MIKHGFTIIELLVSMFIASVLSVSLTNYLGQVYTFQTIITNLIDADIRAIMVSAQFESDLMGIFIPYDPSSINLQSDKKQINKTSTDKSTEQTENETTKEEKKIKPYENVFLAQTKDKQLQVLSMISTNALNVYWSETVGKPKPNITRITYRLIPDPINKQSFMLTRREQGDLIYKPYKDEKQLSDEYVLADGIKELIITYHAQPQTIDDDKDSTNKVESVETHVWQYPKKNESQEEEKEKKEEITLPNMATIELILWNEQYNRSTLYSYAIEIPFVHKQKNTTDEKMDEENKKQPSKSTQQDINDK
jgi:prepilin-type N-terminal cleavage/methylation domain-containing protein